VTPARPWAPASRAPLAALFLGVCLHCGKGAATASPVGSGDGAAGHGADVPEVESALDGDAGPPMDDREIEAWARAADAGEDEDVRLADLVGCTGLRERAADAKLRSVALRAMAHCRDFSELPWLVDLAEHGPPSDAVAALDAVVVQAARVRRATDPEDADELHAGCAELLALARTKERSQSLRVRAIRALRMLADRGCVQRAEIPTELDAK
jgi:hypothetical protein